MSMKSQELMTMHEKTHPKSRLRRSELSFGITLTRRSEPSLGVIFKISVCLIACIESPHSFSIIVVSGGFLVETYRLG